jgi:hypothetical protein
MVCRLRNDRALGHPRVGMPVTSLCLALAGPQIVSSVRNAASDESRAGLTVPAGLR